MGAIEETEIFFKTVALLHHLQVSQFELKVSPFPYGHLYCPNTIVFEKIPPFPLIVVLKKLRVVPGTRENLLKNFIWIE
jgi:hypothetical protein